MDFSQYTLGRVVREEGVDSIFGQYSYDLKPIPVGRLGHITGFDTVEYDTSIEVILQVKWCDNKESTSIHPTRVVLL